jgi:nucleotide-binding universal stress UspA family protein
MVPVDLAHPDRLDKALDAAAGLARQQGSEIVYVGVTAETPGKVAHSPDEFASKLDDFASKQASERGVSAKAHAMVSHDPTVDVDDTLLAAIDETDADLVVMASHVPNVADFLWPSNGGKVASHAKVSVMLVR